MRLYAICLVKNEEDIIGECLKHAIQFCDKIVVIDNGSTDKTWGIVQSLAHQDARIIPFTRTDEPYRDSLRAMGYNAFRCELTEGDWWLVLDADEFLAEDPRPNIEEAMRQDADLIKAWFMQFYYTDSDYLAWQEGNENRYKPIIERRRYYSINWQEYRMFRNHPELTWDAKSGPSYFPDGLKRVSSRRVVIRHYQFRDPEQIERRLKLRHGQTSFAAHVSSEDWRKVIRDSSKLCQFRDDAPWEFTIRGVSYYYRKRLMNDLRRIFHGAVKKFQHVFGAK